MDNLSLEQVCYVIVKSREFHVKVDVVEPDPGSNASDEGMDTVLEDYADDPVYDELVEFINDMNVDEQIELVALTWLGRGTFDKEDWAEAIGEATGEHNNHTAQYLLGMPQLASYLEEGLAAFDLSCSDVEREHL
jgi:hypothetical protein